MGLSGEGRAPGKARRLALTGILNSGKSGSVVLTTSIAFLTPSFASFLTVTVTW